MTMPDEAGCGHYRVRYPAAAAEAAGAKPIRFFRELRYRTKQDELGVAHVVGAAHPEVDVLVMSRPLRRVNMEAIDVFQAAGIAVVVDVDDDFESIHRGHQSWEAFQPQHSPESNRVHLRKACAKADLVTVTTPALAKRYARHGRFVVLPNRVPRSHLGVVAERDERTIGWGGIVGVHPNDLQSTRGGVAMALRECGARFLNVGSGYRVAENLELDILEVDATGVVSFEDYPFEIAKFTVGIAPLAETRFNEGKSALKGLEMAAVGVPYVHSPVPDYERLNADGLGVRADWKSKTWKRAIRQLLVEDQAREEMAQRGRQIVRTRHLYEDHAHLWIEAWETALERRRAQPARDVQITERTRRLVVEQTP